MLLSQLTLKPKPNPRFVLKSSFSLTQQAQSNLNLTQNIWYTDSAFLYHFVQDTMFSCNTIQTDVIEYDFQSALT